ncbi:MAG: hypothetical protein H6626_12220 [Pseudobdellovibrionaceae bacterium]|nr:hypothetical protein [Bdellovibrionales bacterium]USN46953.1 MAG: hypothetical protein H6626_12220 [Pseudobdellovibrionaceae bacterium]
MSTEFILLLSIYAFIMLGVFFGDSGPIETFRNATPRLAARMERNISVGHGFLRNGQRLRWEKVQR